MRSLWTHLQGKFESKMTPTSEGCSSLEAWGNLFFVSLNWHQHFEKDGTQNLTALRVVLIGKWKRMLCPQRESIICSRITALWVFLYSALGTGIEHKSRVKGCAHNCIVAAGKELTGQSATSWIRAHSQSNKTWRNKAAARRREPEEWQSSPLQ